MKAGPTEATLLAVERVIAPGEALTAAEIATRAGMATRYAREILALLIKDGRAWSERREIGDGIVVPIYGRPYIPAAAADAEETITAGRFTIKTIDPKVKAILRELADTHRRLADSEREVDLWRTMRAYRFRKGFVRRKQRPTILQIDHIPTTKPGET